MNIVDDYYNKLLSIVHLKHEAIKSLDVNDFRMKEVINDIIESGNEYMLKEEYLYCFVNIACNYNNFKNKLMNLLYNYTVSNKDAVMYSLMSFYHDILYFNEIDYRYNNLSKIEMFIDNNQIPLLSEIKEQCDIIEKKLNMNDFFLIRDILFIILSYCVVNGRVEDFNDYCYQYVNHSNEVIDSLIINEIVIEVLDFDNRPNYIVRSYELRQYIVSKLNQNKIKIIK